MAGTNLTPSSRYTITMVLVAVLAIITVGGVAWSEGRRSLIDASFDNLASIERTKARQIENYMRHVEDQIVQLSGDLTVVEAAVRLNRGFDAFALEPAPDDLSDTIEEYYAEQFLPRLANNSTGTPDYAIFEPVRPTARQLQYHYMADNANAVGVKHFLDDAGDGSEYSRWHGLYHPGFRSLLERSNYYDFFIVDIESADIVYSVFKEVDVGTNLIDGPYRNSGLGDAVQAVIADPIRESVKVVDFKPYPPSYNAPAAFMAAPIYNGDHPVGVLALQLPIDEINAIMTSESNWRSEGMGESGQTYMVGNDRLMRSDSRFLIEDEQGFLESARAAGLQAGVVEKIDALDSTILLQRIDTVAAAEAIAGTSGAGVITDYRGVEVLSSYSPLDIGGLDWVILSEIDRDEVLAPVDQLLRRVLIAATVFVSLVALVSAWLARRLMRPIREAVGTADRLIERRGLEFDPSSDSLSESDLAFETSSPGSMGELGRRMNLMIEDGDIQRAAADRRYEEFLARVTTAMPWSAGERFRRGEHDAVDIGTRCFAIAVQVADPRGVAGREPGDAAVAASDSFNEKIHEIARVWGVDLFAHVGLEYVGIVGLTASYLDSVDRALAFAADLFDLGASSGADSAGEVDVRIAIDVSAMRGAMQHESPYGYRVWGDAILRAQSLAHQTDHGQLRITSAVHAQIVDHAEIIGSSAVVDVDGESTTSWTIDAADIRRTVSASSAMT